MISTTPMYHYLQSLNDLENNLATIEHHDPILFGAVTDLVSRVCETMTARRLAGDHRTIDRVTELDPVAAIVVADHQLQIVRGLIRTSRCITSDISRASLLVLIDAAVSTLEAPWSDLEPKVRAVVDIRGGQRRYGDTRASRADLDLAGSR